MSVENLKEYARRCATEPELRETAKAIGMADMEEHMRNASSLGLEWDRNDFDSFRHEVVAAGDDLTDLSEEELEQVAGGLFSVTVVSAVAVGAAVGTGVAAAGATAAAGGAAAAGDGGW